MSASFASFRESVQARMPRSAVVLGSGLGAMGSHFRESCSVPFSAIPGLVPTSVGGHAGRLALGEWLGIPALVYFGRLHYYEGHSWNTVTAPIRVAAELGVERIVLTNAAGGIHPELQPGCLMALRGHFTILDRDSWQHAEPATPYSDRLVKILVEAGMLAGNYAALTGPSYETPAEIRAFARMGADAVGMSTAREAEAALEWGLEVAAISCITNRAAGLSDAPLDHADVLANAKLAVDRLGEAIGRLITVENPKS